MKPDRKYRILKTNYTLCNMRHVACTVVRITDCHLATDTMNS